MTCKYLRLSKSKRIEYCHDCITYDCVEIRNEKESCPVCQCTGAADIKGDEIVICRKCIWGKLLEIEQHEFSRLKDVKFF